MSNQRIPGGDPSPEGRMDPVVRTLELLDEIYRAHRDTNDADYNECEQAPCAWCSDVDIVRQQFRDLSTALAQAQQEKVRMFPIQAERGAKPHPRLIPWSVAELAYSVYSSRYGSEQSLQRLAERHGFAPSEMDDYLPDWRERCSEIAQLRADLAALREAHEQVKAERDELRGEQQKYDEMRAAYMRHRNAESESLKAEIARLTAAPLPSAGPKD